MDRRWVNDIADPLFFFVVSIISVIYVQIRLPFIGSNVVAMKIFICTLGMSLILHSSEITNRAVQVHKCLLSSSGTQEKVNF